MDAVGVDLHVKVNVPLPCAEQYTPLLCQSAMDAGAGDTMTLFDAVTPVTDLLHDVVAFQFATVILTATDDITLWTATLPLPSRLVLFTVLMFVPLTRVSWTVTFPVPVIVLLLTVLML